MKKSDSQNILNLDVPLNFPSTDKSDVSSGLPLALRTNYQVPWHAPW